MLLYQSWTKAKRHKQHTAAATALYVTDRVGVQPRPQAKSSLTDFSLQPYSLT